MTEIEVPDIAGDADFNGILQTASLPFSPLTWTLPCRTTESQPGNWTVDIRILADLQVSHRDRLEPGSVSTVPLGLSLIPCGSASANYTSRVDDNALRVLVGLEWARCDTPDQPPAAQCQVEAPKET